MFSAILNHRKIFIRAAIMTVNN